MCGTVLDLMRALVGDNTGKQSIASLDSLDGLVMKDLNKDFQDAHKVRELFRAKFMQKMSIALAKKVTWQSLFLKSVLILS